MIKAGVIGYGYWGPNLVRNLMQLPNVVCAAIADERIDLQKNVQKFYPGIKIFAKGLELISEKDIDAVIIATPPASHYELTKKALQNGKHVLVEKPMCLRSSEAQELIDLAIQKKLTLMVDNTFLYTEAVKKVKEEIDKGTVGKLQYYDSTRVNLGIFQSDINVLWDLATHDLSILLHLLKEKPYSLNATGFSHHNNGIENIAYITLNYQSNFMAHLNCSWTSPVKIRMTLIGAEKGMIVYNDMEPTEKVKIYSSGYTYSTDEERRKTLIDYRTGDIFIPKIGTNEAIHNMLSDFTNSIQQKTTPVSNASIGLDIIKILEASEKSLKEKGKEVIIYQ